MDPSDRVDKLERHFQELRQENVVLKLQIAKLNTKLDRVLHQRSDQQQQQHQEHENSDFQQGALEEQLLIPAHPDASEHDEDDHIDDEVQEPDEIPAKRARQEKRHTKKPPQDGDKKKKKNSPPTKIEHPTGTFVRWRSKKNATSPEVHHKGFLTADINDWRSTTLKADGNKHIFMKNSLVAATHPKFRIGEKVLINGTDNTFNIGFISGTIPDDTPSNQQRLDVTYHYKETQDSFSSYTEALLTRLSSDNV